MRVIFHGCLLNFTETGRAKGKANFHLRETGS